MNTLRAAVAGVPDSAAQLGVQAAGGRYGRCSSSSRSWSSTAPRSSLASWRSPGPNNRRPFNRREWARRLSFVRGFARHRSATDPRTEIPPDGLLPYRPKRARPYLYSDDEIRSLLRAALKLPGRGGLRPWTYHCLFGLLSVSGLRLGEARNLELQDVDLRAAVLTDPGRQVRQVSPGPVARVDLPRARGLPRAPRAALGKTTGLFLPVRVHLGESAWMAARSTARSTRYPGRSVCAVHPTVMGRACTICDIDSP